MFANSKCYALVRMHSFSVDTLNSPLRHLVIPRVTIRYRKVDTTKPSLVKMPLRKRNSKCIRVCTGKLFFLFLNQNICCGCSKDPSQ